MKLVSISQMTFICKDIANCNFCDIRSINCIRILIFSDPTPDEDGVKWQMYTQEDRYFLRLDEIPILEQHYVARGSAFWNTYIYELENITNDLAESISTADFTETTEPMTTLPSTVDPNETKDDYVWALIWTLVGVGGALLVIVILQTTAIIKFCQQS